MTPQDLEELLQDENYWDFQYKDGKICALQRFFFTVAIVVGIDESGYSHRYCYHNLLEAVTAYKEWNGKGDPQNYIKKKGKL